MVGAVQVESTESVQNITKQPSFDCLQRNIVIRFRCIQELAWEPSVVSPTVYPRYVVNYDYIYKYKVVISVCLSVCLFFTWFKISNLNDFFFIKKV